MNEVKYNQPQSNLPLVSICIPVYNSEKWLSETLSSAINQTYTNIEIIVVDDGSTDRSWEIIADFRDKHPDLIKAFKQENKGACAARNKAFSESRGDYIQWLDSDDILEQNKIEKQIRYAETINDTSVLYFGKIGVFRKNPGKSFFLDNELNKDLSSVEWMLTYMNKVLMTQPGAWLIHRKLINAAGLWDENLLRNQDGEYIFRTVSAGKFIKFTPESKIFYRKCNPKSISANYSKEAIDSLFISIKKCINILLEVEKSLRVSEAIQHTLNVFITRHYYSKAPSINEAINLLNSFGVDFTKPEEKIIFKISKIILGIENTIKLKSVYSKVKDLFIYK